MDDLKQILKRSIAHDDSDIGGWRLIVPAPLRGHGLPIDPVLPAYYSYDRDRMMRRTLTCEAMWAGALGIATAKVASADWAIEPESDNRVLNARARRMHEVIDSAEYGDGWEVFLTKLLMDFLTCDNGCFAEIIRTGASPQAPVIGLKHLDSTRCVRTGDPYEPVEYWHPAGTVHRLKRHQVLLLADMPDPDTSWRGVGHCATSRAYPEIVKLAAIAAYILDKVTGRRPTEIHMVNGLMPRQLASIEQTAAADADAQGRTLFMGVHVVPIVSETGVDGYRIPLAEIPDGFDRKQEWDLALLAYANALGLDPQDLQPLTGQSLGTGAQSQVLAGKTRGRTLALFRAMLVRQINRLVMPQGVAMRFEERDLRDQQMEQELESGRIDSAMKMYGDGQSGILTLEQALQWLVDHDVLPDAMLPAGDVTPPTEYTSEDNPEQQNRPGV